MVHLKMSAFGIYQSLETILLNGIFPTQFRSFELIRWEIKAAIPQPPH